MNRLFVFLVIFVFGFSCLFAQEAQDVGERLKELVEAPDDEVRAAVKSGEMEDLLIQGYYELFGEEQYFVETNRLKELTEASEEELRAAVRSGEVEGLLRQVYFDLFGKEFDYDEYIAENGLTPAAADVSAAGTQAAPDGEPGSGAQDYAYGDESDAASDSVSWGEYDDEEDFDFSQFDIPGSDVGGIPGHISNNSYFMESVRYANLAQAAYEEGDYDSAIRYSDESIRYAKLSDDYVALQLKIMEAKGAIATAKERIEWASSSTVNAQTRFPDELARARVSYETAVNYSQGEYWDNAIYFAYDAINALAYTYEIGGTPPLRPAPLPAQYTVRTWESSGDCLWNIAGRPWAYGDSSKWRLLYDANRSKFTSADNPNLIEPGMVLDIPSIGRETRQGMWSPSNAYPPLN